MQLLYTNTQKKMQQHAAHSQQLDGPDHPAAICLHAQPPQETDLATAATTHASATPASAPATAATPVAATAAAIILQDNLLKKMPLTRQCAASQLHTAVLTQHSVLRLTQQMPERSQMCIPTAARCMPPQHVEASCCHNVLLLQGLQLCQHHKLW
jgi:hypothetical protein